MLCFTSLLYFAAVLLVIFLFAVGGYALFIAHRRKKFNHLPGPPVTSFFKGNAGELKKLLDKGHNLDQIFLDWHLKYGKFVAVWFFHTVMVSVADPDVIKDLIITKNLLKSPATYEDIMKVYGQRVIGSGLLTQMDHQKWAKRRKKFNPAFHRSSLKDMMAAFNSSTDLFIERLLEKADGKTEVQMTEEFARAALDVICKVAFGTDLSDIQDPSGKFTQSITKMLEGIQMAPFEPYAWLNPFKWHFVKEVKEATKFIRETGKKIIEVRQLAINHGEQVPNDILQRILLIAEEDPTADIEDMLDELVTFLIAGHETTANKLAFCLMELGDHEHIQKRLEQEVFEVLGERKTVHFDDLAKMHHIGETFKETLRMYPSATGTVRITDKDETIGGLWIPAKTEIVFSSYVMGRHPYYWKSPKEFNPLRYEEEEKDKRSHYTYFPFSLGPRNCIGQHFAQIEAKVILSRFIQTFNYKLVPGQTKAIVDRLTIRPRDGVICTLAKKKP